MFAQIDGKSKIVVTARNNSDCDIENAVVFVAGYENSSMQCITQASINIMADGERSVVLPIPSNGEDYVFKAFVWENSSNMNSNNATDEDHSGFT